MGIISPLSNKSKDLALLDNITRCDRVVGSFDVCITLASKGHFHREGVV
jgi:hypothetical protein